MKNKLKRNWFYQLQYLPVCLLKAILGIATVDVFQKRSKLLILPRIKNSSKSVNACKTLTA